MSFVKSFDTKSKGFEKTKNREKLENFSMTCCTRWDVAVSILPHLFIISSILIIKILNLIFRHFTSFLFIMRFQNLRILNISNHVLNFQYQKNNSKLMIFWWKNMINWKISNFIKIEVLLNIYSFFNFWNTH